MSFIDPTEPPRGGEELDLKVVETYLKDNIPGLEGDLTVEQFPSGHSNLTYMVKVGDRELVLRRPPFGHKGIKSGHDMSREYKVLSKLHGHYAQAPEVLAFCDDESVMGADFYVMERIKGVILRKELPENIDFPPETSRKLCENFVDNLVEIHAIDYKAIGLEDYGRPEGFMERQVEGWAGRYEKSQTDEIPGVTDIIKWSRGNLPESGPGTLIHNDYKFDNMVLAADDYTRIIGVLDWEMSALGDPVFDLAVAIGYWFEKGDPEELLGFKMTVSDVDGMYTREEIVERYAEKTGRDVSNMPFYLGFALFKLAVVLQQIYSRYAKGLTGDERFLLLKPAVELLMKYSGQIIEDQTINFRS